MSRRQENQVLTCDSGGGAPPPDPNVGIAALKNAETADAAAKAGADAQKFAQDFQTQYVAPALQTSSDVSKSAEARLSQESQAAQEMQAQYLELAKQQLEVAKVAQGKQNAVTDETLKQMQVQSQRYQDQGIPAEDAYYKMARDYSSDDFAEKQAGMALGDIKTGGAQNQQQMLRTMASMGIDPTSPAGMSLMGDQALQLTAAGAAAQNKARMAAQTLGMSLTADAANFGRGGFSQILNAAGAASGSASSNASTGSNNAGTFANGALNAGGQAIGATTSGYGVASGQVGTATGGAAVPLAGFNANQSGMGNALKGYTANLDAYTDLSKARMDYEAQNSKGLGSFLGTIGGAAISKFGIPSDRRLKADIQPTLLQYPSGLAIYSYVYIHEKYGAPGRHFGVMADEAQKMFPDAVTEGPDGFLRVDYSKLR